LERRLIGTGLEDPCVDFTALARSLGVHALEPVRDPRELAAALNLAVETVVRDRRTVLVDVITDTDER
jgi:benzoylformate decarboxylase/acetolactate synthase-1/2/3 large subunit